jgi:L-seryl-tRNA(Ser) seleniumtransferase
MSLSSYPAANLGADAGSLARRAQLAFGRGRWARRSGGIIVGGDGSSRRSFFKLLAATPLLSQIAARDLYAQATNAMGIGAQQSVYSRLGVKTVINCRGTWTYLSGSLEFPEVRQAQQQASEYFVNMLELQRAVGRRLAELTGAESGIVTSGSAGAMAAATAGCMAGTNDKLIWQLPDTTGMKHEVVMAGGRSAFDSAIRLTGAKLVLARSPEEIVNAITENTAMIYTTDLREKLQQQVAIAKERNIPLLLDDAAGIPPVDNAKLYARMGIDMYCFSGGKGLRGPQCSGLLLGRKDLIEAALLNSSPREGAVCRAMKIGKEEVIGCLTALETWLKIDEKKLYAEWSARIDRIRKLAETVPGVTTTTYVPDDGNRYPTLTVKWDQQAWGFTISDCVRELRASDPIIEVLGADNPSLVTAVREGNPSGKERKGPDHIELVSMTIKPGEEMIVGQRLRAVLGAAQKKAA